MATKRNAAEVAALTTEAIQRKAEVEADRKAQAKVAPTPAPKATTPGIAREVVKGGRPGPVWGKVVQVDPRAYKVAFHIDMQDGPGRVELRGASRSNVDWETESTVLDGAMLFIPQNGYDPWLKYVRVVLFPEGRKKPLVVAYSIESLRNDGVDPGTHHRRFDPAVSAFEVVLG